MVIPHFATRIADFLALFKILTMDDDGKNSHTSFCEETGALLQEAGVRPFARHF